MSIEIVKGIQLPAFDIEMLSLGKLVVVPFKQYLPEGQPFWLYPSQHLPFGLRLEEYYKPEYLVSAQLSLNRLKTNPIQLRAWAFSDFHWHLYANNKKLLPRIAQSGLWKLSALEHIFEQYQVLKLLFLRVHHLPQAYMASTLVQPGSFYWPQPDDLIVSGSEEDTPALTKASFYKRKELLISGKPNPYISLESLQSQLKNIVNDQLAAQQLSHSIEQLLGWRSKQISTRCEPEWLSTIAAKGERSKEDTEISNYQAGTEFEEVVRQSLEFLGFQVDYSHRGGAGGIDLFCSSPYTLVGECKSGKKIPNDTAVQLLNLGTIRLTNKEEFTNATKLIIGPGEPTEQLKRAAKVHGMAIIHPSTLERLVRLHHQYPGCIDLFQLRDYLVDGQADSEVEKYIQLVHQGIKLRAYIVQLVKDFLENSHDDYADIAQLHAIYVYSNPPQPLGREEMHELLIELSSPLTGYLGRKKEGGSDRFYFLRDLVV